MSMYSTFLSWFGLGSLGTNSDRGPQYGSQASTTTDAGVSVTDERALKLSAVWACTQFITNSVCSLPLNFYSKTKTGREPVTDHYLNDLFHKRPNKLMKPRDFRKSMTMQLVTWSNAYAEIFYAGTRPVALVPLRPGRMTPMLDENGDLSYHYKLEQGIRVYAPASILHLKGFSVEGITGIERNNYARTTMGLSVSADAYAASQFKSGGRSGGGYLSFDEFLTAKQREQARELYSGMSETAYDKGRVWLLEGGVKYEPDNVNPDTMQMIQTRNMQVSEIARFYGVPVVMLDANSSATSAWPASFEQQLLSFLTFTLQDYLDEWESAIRHSLLFGKEQDQIIPDHDTKGFIKMDSTTRAAWQSSMVQNGLKTRNEIRKDNNDPEVEGADDLTVQVNLTPIDHSEGIRQCYSSDTILSHSVN